MTTLSTNTSFVRYRINLFDSRHFGVEAIFASFYASRSFIRSNLNWHRSDLSALGLQLIVIYLLVSPAIMPHLNSGVGSANLRVPSYLIRILQNFSPMTKGNEYYATCGGTESFTDVQSYLSDLISEIELLLKSGDINTFGYQVPGLLTLECYQMQLNRIKHILSIYRNSTSPELLARELLVTLSALKPFEGDDLKFEQFKDVHPITDVQVGYGVRKYIRIAGRRFSFNGDPSIFTVSLYQLLVSATVAELDSDTYVELNSPIPGGTIIILSDLTQGDLFMSLLNAFLAEPGTKSFKRNALSSNSYEKPVLARGSGKPSVNGNSLVLGNARHYSTSVNGQDVPNGVLVDLYSYDGKELKYLGLVRRL